MNSFVKNNTLWLFVALVISVGSTALSVSGQPVYSKPTNSPKPYLQDIQVQKTDTGSNTANAPLINKTSSVSAAYPVLANVDIPGYTGILVETLDGKTVMENYSNLTFNPASNVKVATAYAVLKTFGPDYRFSTGVWTDGSFDETTGTIHGNLYVSGRDPVFNLEHGVALAQELNRMKVRQISGDLIVTDNFVMNYSTSPIRAVSLLQTAMDASKRNAAITRAWQNHLINTGKAAQIAAVPSVSVTGGVYVQSLPTNAKLIFSHESTPMREIIKATLCYSNNSLSERLGDMLGGHYAVARIVQLNTGSQPTEFSLASSSGLGINRVSPKAMMRLLRTLRAELAKHKMTFNDIMPVAGMDKGTLERRFDTDFSRGSVVGKTGTLGNTDAGVSTLSGEINTRNGRLLFVIFNQRGSVPRFRNFQNSLVSMIQGQFGGAQPMPYNPVSLDVRMSNTRFTYPKPDGRARITE